MDTDALHIGVKGMSMGGERRIVIPAYYAFSHEERETFFGESETDLEVICKIPV